MRLADVKRETAAWALARGASNSAAAREVEKDRATIGRWLKDATFAARIEEIRDQLLDGGSESDDPAGEAELGLARLVPIAIQVVEAAMTGDVGPGGRVPTTAQHSNALKTIELARKLEPKATGESSDVPPLKDLIAQAESVRSER